MHPDTLVDLALQDLRAQLAAPRAHGDATPRHTSSASAGRLRAFWNLWLGGWTWYVRAGWAPPAPEGFAVPLAARSRIDGGGSDDRPVAAPAAPVAPPVFQRAPAAVPAAPLALALDASRRAECRPAARAQ